MQYRDQLNSKIRKVLVKEKSQFWQWVGFLCNPCRRADIHAEMHPDKEQEFRDKYFNATRQPVLLSGKSAPFYVWGKGADKYGTQLRVYFYGDAAVTPAPSGLFNVTKGRVDGGLRINKGDFVWALFEIGFLLGKNPGCETAVKANVPQKFKADFRKGFDMMSPAEKMEDSVLDYCRENEVLTVQSSTLQKLRVGGDKSPRDLLDELCKNHVLAKNKEQDAYTLLNTERLRGEIEDKSIENAIAREKNDSKREVLLEMYVRDRGLVQAAKGFFGADCMVDECQNTFRKDDGSRYIETHHIKWLSKGGKDHISNLAMLCAHHHRMAHYAERKVRESLRVKLQRKNAYFLKNAGI
ncbi:MAG: HNH endonuclease [Alphaproteobacteria bacterium]|nr:HNH endonuclease [Gammaproteobacteria bacterium]MDA8009748.1 HNH endonuclease [Alphaproteobacteria bacterium]MDA8030395.1 HNH endonuclease [Alphaproteobacteria bacterium]